VNPASYNGVHLTVRLHCQHVECSLFMKAKLISNAVQLEQTEIIDP